MKQLSIFLLSFALTGCITTSHIAKLSNINEAELKNIPPNSKEVIIERNGTAEELYNDIFAALLSRGHRIDKDDKER